MPPSELFSSGMELAFFVTSSGLLRRSWNAISHCHEDIGSNKGERLSWTVSKDPDSDFTIIAFESTLDFSNLLQELVPSYALTEKNFHLFEFLRTKKNPEFFVNITAISLFYVNYEKLDQLKSEVFSLTPLIVTGHGLGGSIASLFTISLLDSIWLGKNRPLCITFGSPLLGDKKLQEVMSSCSTWSSCFLHVVSLKDPSVTALPPHTDAYMPFGTFLLCSDINSTCFENPESVLALLVAGSVHDQNQGSQSIDYGNIAESLYHRAIYMDFTLRTQDLTHSNSLRACICLQLWSALGYMQQQQHQNVDINALITKLEILEHKFYYQKRVKFIPSKKLNVMKLDMVKLEWYKKYCNSIGIGYYDSYKNGMSTSDQDAIRSHLNLTNYWRGTVEEAKLKPQKRNAAFRKSWLYAGTSYRKMVEPLAIAEYYSNGGKDYVTKNRPEHFALLEEWLRNELTKDAANEEGIGNWEDWSFYLDWRVTVDKCLVSSNGLKVDEEEEDNSMLRSDCENDEAISSTNGFGFQSRVNQLLRSSEGSKYAEENEKSLNSRSKKNDTNNSYYKAHVDELLLSCQGSNKEENVNKFELHVDEAVLSRQGSIAVRELEEFFFRAKKKNVEIILTFDSCFWAHVEEALISCKELEVLKEKEETLQKLVEFEEYVYGLLKNYAVSPEIFLARSSYMRWWNEYKAIKGASYSSPLANFMNDTRKLALYTSGNYDFP
ncbi:unnamed protein product [Sphenostylis stenocarpa]|uniref:Senescence-associated carboxylesterase 101 n=1 Tax=Sphenostylis stenocarpa TaxID=92480 RepID=A0AA86VEV0_9FABA|nr:unnamed protein product [Sphenostylis stenocarpa]